MNTAAQVPKITFTGYEKLVIVLLSIIQFTVILDFMVLSPLGAFVMEDMSIVPSQFGLVVSAYAFSAGASGLLAAGFADRFDRKKILVFFYVGFIVGTALCAIAPDYHFLLFARIVTGLFGGVLGSIGFAIITDIFSMQVRGRVMGFTQMAFAVSQVLGIPIGLLLADKFSWHSPFWMIVGLSLLTFFAIVFYLKPVTEHLKLQTKQNPFQHLVKTISKPDYIRGFLATVLLATGGFMLMPFGSAFSVFNLGIRQDQLFLLYGITGVFSMIFGPLVGKYSDKIGAYRIFVFGSILSIITVAVYTRLGITPFWIIQTINVVLFVSITCRIISSSTIMTAVPELSDRGAFMSINSSIQQIAGGIASAVAGQIVVQTASGKLENYEVLGYVVIVATLFTIGMMYVIHKQVARKNVTANLAN
ncbi:MAG: MFS transporter [Opitutaceae bacterium]|nr:MFS transporter [Cytophagales bacterium]